MGDGINTPTGTVTYTLYPGATCTGAPLSSAQTVSLSGGEAPDSATTGALGAGAYSFDVAYSGDANYNPPTDSCEPFVVNDGPVHDIDVRHRRRAPRRRGPAPRRGTGATRLRHRHGGRGERLHPDGHRHLHALPRGHVHRHAPSSAQTVSLSGGEAPNSATTGALGAGAYSFDVAYSGDANYNPPTDSCEPFVVGKATPSASTQVIDAATSSPWTGGETTGSRAVRHRHR